MNEVMQCRRVDRATRACHKRPTMPGDGLERETSTLSGLNLRLIQFACLVLAGIKIVQWTTAGIYMDEAYYWMWGQHPALSYFDHPPLNAWLLGLSSAVFGWSKLALRAPVVLSFFVDIFVLYLFARRLGGDWRRHFWFSLLLFLATPIFSFVTNFPLPDHLLLTGLLLATYFFFRFFAGRAAGEAGTTRDLMAGALFLGLAGLAKYNAAFLGLGVVAFVLLHDRALLRDARIWLAGLLALAIQTPVIVWNATQRFASYDFILDGRHAGLRASFDGLGLLVVNVLIFVSPFLLWPLGRFLFTRRHAVSGMGFARATFVVSTIAIVALSFTTQTLFHWNLAAYAAALPFLGLYLRPAWLFLPLQTAWGILAAVVILLNFSSNPLIGIKGWRDESAAWSQDWSAVANAVTEAKTANGAAFVATADYTTASLLAFELADPDVVSLAARRDQYDFWFDPAAHAGEDAVLYGDSYRPLTGEIIALFESVTPVTTIQVTSAGEGINSQTVYLGKGFRPAR